MDDMTVGQRFKYFRVQKGYSQTEVGEGICSYSTISHLENDRTIPSAKIMGKLADRLGVPLRDIMGRQDETLDTVFMVEMIRVYVEKCDYDYALDFINEVYKKDDLLEHQRLELIILKAECLHRIEKYYEAIDLLVPFLEQQQQQQTIEDELLCEAYNKLGATRYRLNDFEKAFSSFEQGYRVSLRLPEFGLVAARVTKNLGLTCNQLGFLSDARRYLEKAYTYYERASDQKGIASTLFDLAVATGDLENMKTARLIYESMNMAVESNLAKLHYAYFVEAKRAYPAALADFDACASAFQQLGEHGLAVYSLSRAALACIELDDLKQAEDYLNDAERIYHLMEKEDYFKCADFYKARAKYHMMVKNYDRSIADSHLSGKMYEEIGLFSESADALQIAGEAYSQQGKHDLASELFKKVIELLRRNSRGGLM